VGKENTSTHTATTHTSNSGYYTVDEKRKLLEMYKHGASAEEIATKLRRNKKSVQQKIRRLLAANTSDALGIGKHDYEIVMISCGVERLLEESNDFARIALYYREACADSYLRVKVDGKILTIREADELCGGPMGTLRGVGTEGNRYRKGGTRKREHIQDVFGARG